MVWKGTLQSARNSSLQLAPHTFPLLQSGFFTSHSSFRGYAHAPICSGTWSTSSPLSTLSLLLTWLFLSLSLFLFSPLVLIIIQCFAPLYLSFPPRCHHYGCWAQPYPQVGSLKLTGTSSVRNRTAPIPFTEATLSLLIANTLTPTPSVTVTCFTGISNKLYLHLFR